MDSILQHNHWALCAHGRQHYFARSNGERPTHVIRKAFWWMLYLPRVDIVGFPADSAARFIDVEGNLGVTFEAIEVKRLV